jgi:hypothetical protein
MSGIAKQANEKYKMMKTKGRSKAYSWNEVKFKILKVLMNRGLKKRVIL